MTRRTFTLLFLMLSAGGLGLSYLDLFSSSDDTEQADLSDSLEADDVDDFGGDDDELGALEHAPVVHVSGDALPGEGSSRRPRQALLKGPLERPPS